MATIYQRLTDTFESQGLMWILSNTLDRAAIVKLSNTCGLTYNGMRTKSMPSHKLVPDLVGEFFNKESAAGPIIKSLAKASSDEISNLKNQDYGTIKNLPDEAEQWQQKQLCHTIVAMAMDDRADVNNTVPAMLSLAETHIAEFSNQQSMDEENKNIPSSPSDQSSEGNNQNTLEVASEKNKPAHLIQKNSHLEKPMENLSDKIQELQRKIENDQHENRVLVKTLADRDREIQYLKEQIENRLEKSSQTESFEQNIIDVKQVVQDNTQLMKADHEMLKTTMTELHKEIQALRDEALSYEGTRGARRARGGAGHDRVGIFVDVQNMFYAARQYGARLDFEKLMQAAVDDRRLIKAIAYVIQTPEVDQTGFVAMLQQRSYQVKRKDLRLRSDGSAKGDWDMGMAIDMIGMADKLDVIVLVSGDGDFVSLVSLLKEMGPRVEVFSFQHNTARDLMEVADRHHPIEDDLLIKMDRPNTSETEQKNVEDNVNKG